MAAKSTTIADPQGIFTPAAISAEMTEYMRVNRVDYSCPGVHAGIRQHECIDGRVNCVQVHPSFPAEPVMVDDGVWGHGFSQRTGRATFRTSDRRAAIKLAKVQRSQPDINTHLLKAENAPKICAAVTSAIALLADFMSGGTLDRTSADYKARAIETLDLITWDHESPAMTGHLIWGDVGACMVATTYTPEDAWRVDGWARKLANKMAWYLRRMGDQGLIANRAVTDLCDQLRDVSGQGK